MTTPKTQKALIAKCKTGQSWCQRNLEAFGDDDYRQILKDYGGAKGDAPSTLQPGIDLHNVIARLHELGFPDTRPARAGEKPLVAASKQALIDKIDAYLAEADLPFVYAVGIARRQFPAAVPAGSNVTAPLLMQWLTPQQLRGVVAALEKSAQRHKRATA